jgi:competence protein ComEA
LLSELATCSSRFYQWIQHQAEVTEVDSGGQPSLTALTRRQVVVWAAVGLVILLVGGNYLRGHLFTENTAMSPDSITETVGLQEENQKAAAEPILIKVHVAGAVAAPGLYEMENEARVADAINSAGGPLEGADLNRVNLAAKLSDGQQVVVPRVGEAAVSAAPSDGGSGLAGAPGGKVNINTAAAAQLEQIDGVGPKTADKIIAYREEHGGFKSIEELMEVPGIGPSKFDSMKDQVEV